MMSRTSFAASAAVICLMALPAAAASPGPHGTPGPRPTKTPAFSSHVHVPQPGNKVSAADCRRRNTAVSTGGGTMGPDGASKSQTLVAVPMSGSNVAAATRQQQLSEACNKQPH